MFDAAQLFLLDEIFGDLPALIQIGVDGIFVHVVQKIKIEIFHAALFELRFKHGGRVVAFRDLMAGEFIRQIKAFPGVLFQNIADHLFGKAGMVGHGGIKIIHAVGKGIIRHLFHQFPIDFSVLLGQAHEPKTQQGQFLVFECAFQHG